MEITSYEMSSMFEMGLIFAPPYFREKIDKSKRAQGLFEGNSDREKLKG